MLFEGYLKTSAMRLRDAAFRADAQQGMVYDEPAGDPGWFGPDSAIWYVHSHLSVALGGWAGLYMEPLHPVFAAAAVEHSVIYHGTPSWNVVLARLSRSASFVSACTFGSTATAERACKIVSAMHKTVVGTLPSGQPYQANDPDALRFAYATLALGSYTAHRKYHPHPLEAERADEYFSQWAQIAKALGASDLPETLAGVEDYLNASSPRLALTQNALAVVAVFEGLPMPAVARPFWRIIEWAGQDILPPWARQLYRYPDTSPVGDWLRHHIVKAGICAFDQLADGLPEQHQALDRINRGQLLTAAS